MLTVARTLKTAFSAAVAAALALGATDVRASAAPASACTIDYQAGQIGACQSTAHCQGGCLWFYPENGGTGFCWNGCCQCAT
jgi:hypothetical protein